MHPAGTVLERGQALDGLHARRQQQYQGQHREGEVERTGGRSGWVPIDESHQRAVAPDRVPRCDVVMADHQAGMPGLPGEPGSVLRRNERCGDVVQLTSPSTNLAQGRIGSGPRRPRHPVADCLTHQVRQNLSVLLVKPRTRGAPGKSRDSKYRRTAWTVEVHGCMGLRTVSEMRTTPTVLPPARNRSSIWTLVPPARLPLRHVHSISAPHSLDQRTTRMSARRRCGPPFPDACGPRNPGPMNRGFLSGFREPSAELLGGTVISSERGPGSGANARRRRCPRYGLLSDGGRGGKGSA